MASSGLPGNLLDVISCNVCRCSEGHIPEMLEDLTCAQRGVYCLQETSSWRSGDEMNLQGWSVFRATESPAATMLPSELSRHVRETESADMHEGTIMNEVGIISTYLPDIEKSIESYSTAVDSLHRLRVSLRSKGPKIFVVAGDLQVELPPLCDDLTGPCARGRPYSRQHWDRVHILLGFMRTLGLRAVNTWAGDGEFVTRNPWGRQASDGRQLDYVLATRSLQSNSGVSSSKVFRSDHLAVWASLRGQSMGLTRRSFRKNLEGWTPVDEKAAREFCGRVAEEMCLDSIFSGHPCDEECVKSLDEVCDIVQRVAQEVKYTTSVGRRSCLHRRPQQLVEAEGKARGATAAEERRSRRKEARRLRRVWTVARLKDGLREGRAARDVQVMHLKDGPSKDRRKWAIEFSDHCKNKYNTEAEREMRDMGTEGGGGEAVWHLGITMAARGRMLRGKSSGGDDCIVAEMIQALPWLAAMHVHNMFVQRFRGDTSGEPEGWRRAHIVYLAKTVHPTTFKDFRGISLLSVLSKWYMGGLMEFMGDWMSTSCPNRWRSLMVFGFEPGHSPEQVQTCLGLLLQKGVEWSQQMPVYVLSGDVLAAFDHLTPQAVQEAMRYWEVPHDLQPAMVSESRGLSCKATPLSLESREVPLSACERQGGVETTWKWNMVTRMVLDMVVGSWAQAGMGVDLPDLGRVSHLVWADNFYLVAHSKEDITHMLQMLSDVTAAYGLTWKRTSLVYTHSVRNQQGPLWFWQEGQQVPVQEEGFLECLGAIINSDGKMQEGVDHRLKKATAAFWANKELLTSPAVPIPVRLREYVTRVQSVAVFGCACWTWTKSTYDSLLVWQNSILKKMIRVPKGEDEGFVAYYKRRNRICRRWFHKCGHTSLLSRFCISYTRWQAKLWHTTMVRPPSSCWYPQSCGEITLGGS